MTQTLTIPLSFDLYRLHDRVYEGINIFFDAVIDADDVLKNNLQFDKNLKLQNYRIDPNATGYLNRIRANTQALINDVESFTSKIDNIKEIIFESIDELQGENPALEEFSNKYFEKFYPSPN